MESLHPNLQHAMNEDNYNRRLQFCEWSQRGVREDEESVNKTLYETLWSDEATFKLNGTIKRHNCVYLAPEGGQYTRTNSLVWTAIQGVYL
jgi:hypothetical protein